MTPAPRLANLSELMANETLRQHVERKLQKWITEQGLDFVCDPAKFLDNALTELAAENIARISDLADFDLEGIWER